MQEYRVKIERLVHEGHGLGYLNGRVIFVPYSVSGDELLVEVVSTRKGVQWGEIRQILVPSPSRTTPFCPNYIACGGCQWQHIAYPAQLEYKRQILADTLSHLAGLKDIPVSPCTASPKPQGYRHRVRLHWQAGRGLGFYKPQTHTVIPIETCPLLSEGINARLKGLSAYLRSHPIQGLTEVQLMEGSEAQVVLTLLLKFMPKSYPWARDLEKIGFAGITVWAGDRRQTISGRDYAENSLNNWNFRVSAGVFFQANLGLLPVMVRQVLSAIVGEGMDLGVELYSGVGVFSLPLSGKVSRLVTIEWNRQAVADAVINLQANSVRNVIAYPLAAEEGIELLSSQKLKPDLMVMDPPREGLSDAVCQGIWPLAPRQIIYISCNPATLARDLKIILAGGNYRLAEVQPLDMFPHTSHIEAVANLLKLSAA